MMHLCCVALFDSISFYPYFYAYINDITVFAGHFKKYRAEHDFVYRTVNEENEHMAYKVLKFVIRWRCW